MKNLTIEQLSRVKTLYGALLDHELEKKIEEEYSRLLKKQKEKKRKRILEATVSQIP